MKLYLIIPLFLIAACASKFEPDIINVITAKKMVDKESPEVDICGDFNLSLNDIKKYFSVAREISAVESHHVSNILPCKYKGEIVISGKQYVYEIYAGGSGFLYDKDGWLSHSYICGDIQCCKNFKNLC